MGGRLGIYLTCTFYFRLGGLERGGLWRFHCTRNVFIQETVCMISARPIVCVWCHCEGILICMCVFNTYVYI